jgi:hypothetical protein
MTRPLSIAGTLSRRDLLAAALTVGAGALVEACGGSTTTAPAPEPPPCMPAKSPAAFWNVSSTANLDPNYDAYIRALESKLGRRFAGIRKNYWPNPGEPQVSPEITAAYAAGRRWTYMNGKPDPMPPDTATLRWRSVTQGVYDDQFAKFFDAVKRDRRWSHQNPFHYSFHHEQEVTSEDGGPLAGHPEDYPPAFRHVRALMDSTGAHVSQGGNMLMCWSPDWQQLFNDGNTSWHRYPYDASHCDPWSPGDTSPPYDLMGGDVYRPPGAGLAADEMWTPIYDWSKKRGVPFFTGETGIVWTPGATDDVVRYLDELERLLTGWGAGTSPGQCVAICWTSRQTRGGDDRLDADPTLLTRYRAMAHAPLFAACPA